MQPPIEAWNLRFLTRQLTKCFEFNELSNNIKIVLNDIHHLLSARLTFPTTSRFFINRSKDNLKMLHAYDHTVVNIISTREREQLNSYLKDERYTQSVTAAFGPPECFREYNPSCTITIYDHDTETVKGDAWSIFGIELPTKNILGITPDHYISGYNEKEEHHNFTREPTFYLTRGEGNETLLGNRDKIYLRLLDNFIASEDKRAKAKILKPALEKRTEAPKGEKDINVNMVESISDDPKIASRAMKHLKPIVLGIKKRHDSTSMICNTCAAIGGKSCVDECISILIHNMARPERQLYGSATKYAIHLLSCMKNEQIEASVHAALECLSRPVAHNSHTKPINSIVYFLQQCIKTNNEAAGKATLNFLNGPPVDPAAPLLSQKVQEKLAQWARDTVTSTESQTWIDISVKLGMETPSILTFIDGDGKDSACGASVLKSNKIDDNKDPLSIAAYNVNGLKKRWSLNDNDEQPQANDPRKDSFQQVVRKLKIPDIFFITEPKMSIVTMNRLPNFLTWRKEVGYTNLYSTWSKNAKKGGAGYAGISAFTSIAPSAIVYGFKHRDNQFNESYEGRVLTLIYPSVIVIGTYSPCSGYDNQRRAHKISFEKELQAHIYSVKAQNPNRGIVLTGDLNVNPRVQDCHPMAFKHMLHTKKRCNVSIDTPNPGCYPEEIDAYRATCTAMEGTNLFEHLYPKDTHGQTWVSPLDPRGIKEWGQRIDHSVVSQSLLNGKCKVAATDIKVYRLGSSDHWPILTTFKLAQELAPDPVTISTLTVLGVYRTSFAKCEVNTIDNKGNVHHIHPATLPVASLCIIGQQDRKIDISSFIDTGSPLTIFNPLQGFDRDTDPLMKELTERSRINPSTPYEVSGVGGGKIVIDNTVSVGFDLGLSNIIWQEVAFLKEHVPTLPRFLLGMDCVIDNFKGMHLKRTLGDQLRVTFDIAPNRPFQGTNGNHTLQGSTETKRDGRGRPESKAFRMISHRLMLKEPECMEDENEFKEFESASYNDEDEWMLENTEYVSSVRSRYSITVPPRSHSKVYIEQPSLHEKDKYKGLDLRYAPMAGARHNVCYGPVDEPEWVQVGNLSNDSIYIRQGEVLAHLVGIKPKFFF